MANGPNIFPGAILPNFYTSFQRRGEKNIGSSKIDSRKRTNVYVFIYVYVFIGRVFYIQNCFNLILIDDNNTRMQFDQLSDVSSIYI